MINAAAVVQHRAKVEETAMKLSDIRTRLLKIGNDIYEHRNWLNGWLNPDALKAHGMSGEHARRTAELSRLNSLRISVNAECDALESELRALQAQHFDPADIFAERAEAYRAAVAHWGAAKADEAKLMEQGKEAVCESEKAAAGLASAEHKQNGALSLNEAAEASKAVAKAVQHKACCDTLVANINKALERATGLTKAASSAVKTLEREMLAAKVDAALEALRNTPAFEEVNQALESAFDAGHRAERWRGYDRFLAHAFRAEGGMVPGGAARMASLRAENAQALGIVDVVEN